MQPRQPVSHQGPKDAQQQINPKAPEAPAAHKAPEPQETPRGISGQEPGRPAADYIPLYRRNAPRAPRQPRNHGRPQEPRQQPRNTNRTQAPGNHHKQQPHPGPKTAQERQPQQRPRKSPGPRSVIIPVFCRARSFRQSRT